MFVWPSITGRIQCHNKFFPGQSEAVEETVEPIVPETLGEAASLEKITIEYLCLAAVYQLLEEGKLGIVDVQQAYQRGASSSS
jgi:hypothetical protein